jgi:hypothetical protein
MSALSSFRARFDAMVAALRAHPQIAVYDVVLRPPASEAAIRDAEAALGVNIPEDMLAFYRTHDGVFLEWGLRDQEYVHTDAFGFPDDNHPPGCINLLPVADAWSTSWEADSHVNTIQPDHQRLLFGRELDLECGAIVIDNFARYNHADLVLGPDPAQHVMVVSTDYGADMDSSDYTDFGTYLDLTLKLFATNRYYQGLGIGWSREPRRVTTWTQTPTLDDLLVKLADD